MSGVLRLTLFVIAAACIALFIFPPYWFPVGASAQSVAVDHQFKVAFWIVAVMFVAGQLVLMYVLTSGSRSQGQPKIGNWWLEMAWTLVVAGIFFWLNISGERVWSSMIHSAKQPDPVQVEVTGAQFQWYFRYPGRDGAFGHTDAQKFARPAEGNALGIDPSDPAGQDDIVSTTMVLPVGKTAQLNLRAQDVIHSLFIPAMRFKQDTVPGMSIESHFTPTQIGNYEIACSQLCGIGHYRMRAMLRVVSEEEFQKWLQEQALQEQGKNAGD